MGVRSWGPHCTPSLRTRSAMMYFAWTRARLTSARCRLSAPRTSASRGAPTEKRLASEWFDCGTPVDQVHAAVDASALGRERTLAYFFLIFFWFRNCGPQLLFHGRSPAFHEQAYERLLGFSRKLDNSDFLKQIAKLCGA